VLLRWQGTGLFVFAAMPDLLANLDPPTPADFTAAHSGVFRALIGQNLGTPPPDHPILDVYGQPQPPEHLFVFPMECSNQGLDTYGTHMDRLSIDNFAADSTRGTAVMLGHLGPMGEQPVGYSYAGAVVEEDAGPQQRLVADTAIRFGARFARAVETFYIVRGLALASKPNDEVIRGIETRTTRDGSVTFIADRMICDLCGLDVFGGACPHIPLVRYPGGGGALVRATVENRNSHKVETSLVYAHATPETGVVPVKARMVAAAGPLTPQEATDLQTLEARWGRRMIDPAHYRQVATVSLPARSTPMPATKPAQRADAGAPPPADPTAPAGDTSGSQPNHTDLVGTVSDAATATAQALTDQIAGLQAEIANAGQTVQGLNDQITALGNQMDGQGSPIDNSAQIAALQTQLDAANADQDARNQQLAGLQAALDAQNATATATGGTPADAPAADTSGAAPPPAAVMNQARAVLTQMRAWARALAPVGTLARSRSIDPTALQPIVDGLAQLIQDLQSIMADTGTPPPMPMSVRSVFDLLATVGVPRGLGQYAAVLTLTLEAPAGKRYRAALIDEIVKGKRRVLGDAAVNEPATRASVAGLTVAMLEDEVRGYYQAAGKTFAPGRLLIEQTAAEERSAGGHSPSDDDSPYLTPPSSRR
jgi:hypothetical protein